MFGLWKVLWFWAASLSSLGPCGHDHAEPDDRRMLARPLERGGPPQRLCAADQDWFFWQPPRRGVHEVRLELLEGRVQDVWLEVYAPRKRRAWIYRPDKRGLFKVRILRAGIHRLRLRSRGPIRYRLVPPLEASWPDDAPAGGG